MRGLYIRLGIGKVAVIIQITERTLPELLWWVSLASVAIAMGLTHEDQHPTLAFAFLVYGFLGGALAIYCWEDDPHGQGQA